MIDYDSLRRDLEEFLQGAFFAGGFGAALIDLSDVTRATNEELVRIAVRLGSDLDNYKIERGFRR